MTPYAVTIVFTDLRELQIPDVLRHALSDDLHTLEVDSVRSVFIVPMLAVKYVAVDAVAFSKPATSGVGRHRPIRSRTRQAARSLPIKSPNASEGYP